MSELGIRELKKRASEIVRAVKENRSRYVITLRGRPVAVLMPLEDAPVSPSEPSAWEQLVALGEQIAQKWTAEHDSAEILSGMRR
jgi:prevent-host-death family protein